MSIHARHRGIFLMVAGIALLAILIVPQVLAQDAGLDGYEPGDIVPYEDIFPSEEEIEKREKEGKQFFPPPGNFRATSVTCTSVSLAWDDVFLATSFRVTYSENGTTWMMAGTTSGFSMTVGNLARNTSYQFAVQAGRTGEGYGAAATTSAATVCTPSTRPPTRPPTNADPVFTEGLTTTRRVDENTPEDEDFGNPVSAMDANGDTLTYSKYSGDTTAFTVASNNGQLSTEADLDYESKRSYSVVLQVSDGRGGTDRITVTISVNDVDEPPPAPASPTVTAKPGTVDSLDVSWTAPVNTGKPPVTSYDLEFRARGSGQGYRDGPQGVQSTSIPITGLLQGTTYEVRVRATNDEGDSEYSLPGVGETAKPAVTIRRNAASVREGHRAMFTITASPPPTKDITVTVEVAEVGEFLHGTPDTEVEMMLPDGGQVTYGVLTADDQRDEADGRITVTLQPGDDYVLLQQGQPPFMHEATVAVTDHDTPLIPSDLRANGHRNSNGDFTLRWDRRERYAASYDVQYREVDCTDAGVCTPDPDWTLKTRVTATGVLIKDALFGGKDQPVGGTNLLASDVLYEIQARSKVYETSGWSNTTLVFPRAVPLSRGQSVGTLELYRFQADGLYEYMICTPDHRSVAGQPLPQGAEEAQIREAVNEWSAGVIWEKSNGDNILRMGTGPATTDCYDPKTDRPRPFDQIIFLDVAKVKAICPGTTAIACVHPQEISYPMAEGPRSILMPVAPDVETWTFMGAPRSSCSMLHNVMMHEVGHPIGVGHTTGKTPHTDSVMYKSYRPDKHICAPSPHDAVAIIANYQSR